MECVFNGANKKSIINTMYMINIFYGNEIIGMKRIVGDKIQIERKLRIL